MSENLFFEQKNVGLNRFSAENQYLVKKWTNHHMNNKYLFIPTI